MARIKKWSPVIIEWDDAMTEHDPVNSDELGDLSTIRRTIGFLLRRNAKEYVVCMEDDRGMDSTTHDCQTVTRIPRKMVQRVIPLEAKP